MGAKFNQLISNILNSTLPTATGGKPGTWSAYSVTSAMLARLNSTLSTASAEGTQLASGNGYTTGGTALGASTPSSAGGSVTLPVAQTSWTFTTTETIESVDITDAAPTPTWFAPVNGQPISIVNGNTFAFAANAITATDS